MAFLKWVIMGAVQKRKRRGSGGLAKDALIHLPWKEEKARRDQLTFEIVSLEPTLLDRRPLRNRTVQK
jgi:hypothetical protein